MMRSADVQRGWFESVGPVRIGHLLGFLALVFLGGCGSGRSVPKGDSSISGTVTWQGKPLAQGTIIPGKDPNTRAPIMGTPGVNEMPPGNSTNVGYNIVHIDPLTGRAKLEYHKMQ